MLNKVQLIGRLGKDPEVRELESGKKVANFSMATSETFKDNQGNNQESTEWHNVVLWQALAGIAESYLKKGSQVFIEGKLKTRSWEKDGVTRYVTEVLATNLIMLGSKAEEVEEVPFP